MTHYVELERSIRMELEFTKESSRTVRSSGSTTVSGSVTLRIHTFRREGLTSFSVCQW